MTSTLSVGEAGQRRLDYAPYEIAAVQAVKRRHRY